MSEARLRSGVLAAAVLATVLMALANSGLRPEGAVTAQGGETSELEDVVATLPNSAFKSSDGGLRTAMLSRLETIEGFLAAGDIDRAIQNLENLRRRVDGCPPKADNDDWIVDCTAQVKVRGLIDAVIANHFSYTIDERIVPSLPALPGFMGGPPRPVGVAVGPDGTAEEFVLNEVVLRPESADDLNAFLKRYDGTVLHDGTPMLIEGLEPPPAPPEPSGWYLIRVNLNRSSLNDLTSNMEAAGLQGMWSYSSNDAARLAALVAREAEQEVAPNFMMYLDQCRVCEHPDNSGGHLDAATWWWMTEDDNPNIPGDQGLSIGVVRAWEYVRYMGYPRMGVPIYPTRVAVIDGGFDLDETTGAPLNGNLDYPFHPIQIDMVEGDWTAGGLSFEGNWHGQATYGIALADRGNGFGTAGTSGGPDPWEIREMVIRTNGDAFTVGWAVRTAEYNHADVINMSLGSVCSKWCQKTFDAGFEKSSVEGADIVVAAAGNEGWDVSAMDKWPCKLKGVVCVGAIDSSAGRSIYSTTTGSNWGSGVDIWAPDGIRSTVTRGSADCPPPTCDTNDTGIDELDLCRGTSCATPFVAGIVALMKMLDRNLGSYQIEGILSSTANTSSTDPTVTGYVDAYRAVAQVKPNQPPTVKITSPGASAGYHDIVFRAEVNDPESPSPIGVAADFSSTLVFRSSRDGRLCTDTGDATGGGTALGCTVPQLSLGTHVITATATDPFGATGSASITIEVVNTPPIAKITYPESGRTYFTSQKMNLRGYGFDPDEASTSLDLSWSSDLSGSLGAGSDIWVSLPQGTHAITLTVKDSKGATDTDTITINVVAGAGYPTAQILKPANNTTVGPGTLITFEGKGTDPEDGDLPGSSLEWYSDVARFLGTGKTLDKILSGGECGTTIQHWVTLRVTDSDGNEASHSIIVNVAHIC